MWQFCHVCSSFFWGSALTEHNDITASTSGFWVPVLSDSCDGQEKQKFAVAEKQKLSDFCSHYYYINSERLSTSLLRTSKQTATKACDCFHV